MKFVEKKQRERILRTEMKEKAAVTEFGIATCCLVIQRKSKKERKRKNIST